MLTLSALLLVGVVVSYFAVPSFQDWAQNAWEVLMSDDKQRIKEWVSQYGAWGPALLILLMVVQMFLLVMPTVLLMVIAVLAYGPIWGTVINVVAILTASTVGYALGRSLSEESMERLVGRKTVKKITTEANRYGLWAVVIARLSPFLSNDAISFIAGILRLGFWQYLLATVAGILPLALMIAYFGQNNDSMKVGLIVVSVVGLLVLGVKIWFDRKSERKESSGTPAASAS